MEQKSVYKCTAQIPGSRVDHHSLWFINNDNIVVFVYDVKRNVLRLSLAGLRGRNTPGAEPVRRPGWTRSGESTRPRFSRRTT